MSHVRWAVAGPGWIATRFAQDMALRPEGRIVSVASRSLERASTFADAFGIDRRTTYEGLADDADVDVVYVATPASRHVDDVIRYLNAGKHVLCEKPLALNHHDAAAMVGAARASGRMLLEAVWSRYLPAYRLTRQVVDDGRIGRLLQVEAEFSFAAPASTTDRLFDPARGGGSLLDLGIYPLQLCTWLLGAPTSTSAVGVIGTTGVDEQVAAVLAFPGEALGVVKCGLRLISPCGGRITGTSGYIELPGMMHCPTSVKTFGLAGNETFEAPFEGNGLVHEIDEVHRCLAQGLVESPEMPWSESLLLASTMDEIRRQIGMRYPHEHEDGTPSRRGT